MILNERPCSESTLSLTLDMQHPQQS